MSNFHSAQGAQQAPGPNSFRKGLGFFRNSMAQFFQDPIIELVKMAPKFSRICSSYFPQKAPESTIPLVNLDNLSELKGEARKHLVKSFGDALQHEGFVAIYAPSLSPLIDRVRGEMKGYFNQPFEKKILDWKQGQQGYRHRGLEFAPDSKCADIKETYYVPTGFDSWPKQPPTFSRTVSEYQSYMHEYAKSLLKVLYEYLGQEHAEVDESIVS